MSVVYRRYPGKAILPAAKARQLRFPAAILRFDLVLRKLCTETARAYPARGNMANTTKIEDKAERKALKRAARKKAAPKGPRTGPRGENKQKLKKAARGQAKRK
jgi:hypothetical protein